MLQKLLQLDFKDYTFKWFKIDIDSTYTQFLWVFVCVCVFLGVHVVCVELLQ